MSQNRTHYDILGVADDASLEQIKKAYRAKSLQCHPDKFPNDSVKADEFIKLSAAFAVLGDEKQRQQYDDSLKTIEEDVIEMTEANTYAEGDQLSLVVSNRFNLEKTVEMSGINDNQLFEYAKKDATLAVSIFTNSALFEKLIGESRIFVYPNYLALEYEVIALMVVGEEYEYTKKFNCYELAKKFASVRKLVLDAENKSEMITAEQEALLRALGSSNTVNEPEQKTEIDNPLLQELNPELVALSKLSPNERIEAAKKSLKIAQLLVANPWPPLPREYAETHMPGIIYIASQHEEVALELLDNPRHRNVLRENMGKWGERTKAVIYLANLFSSVKNKLVNAEPQSSFYYLNFDLTFSEFNALLSDDLSPLKDQDQQARVINYRKLCEGNFIGIADDAILTLLKMTSLSPNDLLELILNNKRLVNIAYQNDELLHKVDQAKLSGWAYPGRKYEDIALKMVKEKKLPSFTAAWQLASLATQWLSVCIYVLQNPELASLLSGEKLFELEKKHGVVVTRLISAAGLSEKLHAYATLEVASAREGGFNTKKKATTITAKKADKSEQPLQRALLIKNQLGSYSVDELSAAELTQFELMTEYFYQAAKLGNENAYAELVSVAHRTKYMHIRILAVEAAYIAGKADLAIDEIKTINATINPESLVNFLSQVQVRLKLAENQKHLVAVGNLYFDIIVALTEDERIASDPITNDAYRLLADMFKENEPGIALQFISQIPSALCNQMDLLNMAEWALANEYNIQLTELPSGPLLDPEAITLKQDRDKAKRYCAALPYYLRLSRLDETIVTRIERIIFELTESKISEIEKGQMFSSIAWATIEEDRMFIPQAKSAWEKASEYKNDIATYVVNNYAEMQQDAFLFSSLKLMSQKNLINTLPLLDSVRALPATYKAAREQFINFLSQDNVTEEMVLARAARLEKLHELVKAKKGENDLLLVGMDASLVSRVNSFYEQDFSDPAIDSDMGYKEFEAKITKKNQRIPDRKKRHAAVIAAIDDKLNVLIDQLKLKAYHQRAKGHDDKAICSGIRVNILSELKAVLISDANHYFTQDFSLDTAPADETAFRDQLIATINQQFSSVSNDLVDNASWFTWVAYNLVRALHAVLPNSTTVAGWMNNFQHDFTAIPDDSKRDDIRDRISASLN